MKEMKEKLVSYEDVESFILNQVNKIHIYRMVYYKELRKERDWEYYLHDSMDDGYKIIHEGIDKYLFTDCTQEYTDKVLSWYYTSVEMLKDFRFMLRRKYNKQHIHCTIKGFTTRYKKNYKLAIKDLL